MTGNLVSKAVPSLALLKGKGSLNFWIPLSARHIVCVRKGGDHMGDYVTWALLFQYTTIILEVVGVVIDVVTLVILINHNKRK